MSNQNEATQSLANADTGHFAKLFEVSDRILIKKLSKNDRDWARFSNKHQAGVYIPHM